MIHRIHQTRTSHVLSLIALILTLCLAAIPAFAADPEEADPDPEQRVVPSSGSVTRELILTDPAELDPRRLEPGRYRVRIVDAEGTKAIYEIVVSRLR